MLQHNLLVRGAYFAILVVIVLLLVRLFSYITSTTANEVPPLHRLQIIQQVDADDINEIWISAASYDEMHKRKARSASLHPKTDRKDIKALLDSIKRIKISNKSKRVPAVREHIFIRSQKGTIALYGYFDPSRAPVISPKMRSDNLSLIVQDILKRKGSILQLDNKQSNSRGK